MQVRTWGAIVVMVSMIGCAHVRSQFAVYDGPPQTLRGTGGTKLVFDGVDVWTTGTPAREYRVVGILTDTRRDQRFAAASFGQDIAAEVKKAGGSAVIVIAESTQFLGSISTGQNNSRTNVTLSTLGDLTTGSARTTGFSSGQSMVVSDKTTQLLVIAYLR